MSNLIERLNGPQYTDAIDEAINEIELLRSLVGRMVDVLSLITGVRVDDPLYASQSEHHTMLLKADIKALEKLLTEARQFLDKENTLETA